MPILGVCLGHQAIGQVYGGRIVRAPEPMHGKLSRVHHTGKSVFRGLNNDFLATRYHSLTIDPPSMPASLEVTATSEDGVIQGVMHKTHPVHGVQFHPESIASRKRPCPAGQFPGHRARLRQSPGLSMKVTSASVDFPAALAMVREGGSLDADATRAGVRDHHVRRGAAKPNSPPFSPPRPSAAPPWPSWSARCAPCAPPCARSPRPPGAIDLCGTGGDGHGTLNISTAVSFVVAAAGVPVAKHGNRSATSKSGAADILEALGVKIDLEPARASDVLAETGIVFLFAQIHHPAMRHVAKVRSQIKQRTIFNLLGPLASPARVKHQLVGIYDKNGCVPYAEALKALGSDRALVVHGADGLDEITITDVTHFASLENGQVIAGDDRAGRCRAWPRHAGRPQRRRRGRQCGGAQAAVRRRKRPLPRHRAAECRRGPDGGGRGQKM